MEQKPCSFYYGRPQSVGISEGHGFLLHNTASSSYSDSMAAQIMHCRGWHKERVVTSVSSLYLSSLFKKKEYSHHTGRRRSIFSSPHLSLCEESYESDRSMRQFLFFHCKTLTEIFLCPFISHHLSKENIHGSSTSQTILSI